MERELNDLLLEVDEQSCGLVDSHVVSMELPAVVEHKDSDTLLHSHKLIHVHRLALVELDNIE